MEDSAQEYDPSLAKFLYEDSSEDDKAKTGGKHSSGRWVNCQMTGRTYTSYGVDYFAINTM